MKILNIIFICIIGASIIISCEENSDIETPQSKPKLVIHSFISPSDTALLVHVGATTNLFGKLEDYPDYLPVKVKLLDGDQVVEFSDRDKWGFCTAKHNIQPGRQYKIIANCDKYPEASAICRVPELKNNFNITIDTTSEYFQYDWGTYVQNEVVIEFKDFPEQINYYNLVSTLHSVFVNQHGESYFPYNLQPLTNTDNIVHNNLILNDQLVDGKIIKNLFYGHSITDMNFYKSVEIEAVLMETDENYYKYHKSINNQRNSDDPFTEYSPVYSNVTGGYGIFASYVSYKKVLKLK